MCNQVRSTYGIAILRFLVSELCIQFGSNDGRCVQMTEDHRVTSLTERRRIQEAGLSLRDKETRIFGI